MLGLISWALFMGIIAGGEIWYRIANREEYQWKRDVIALVKADKPREKRREAPARGRYASCPGIGWKPRDARAWKAQ